MSVVALSVGHGLVSHLVGHQLLVVIGRQVIVGIVVVRVLTRLCHLIMVLLVIVITVIG